MMRRLVWVALGAAVGIAAARTIRKKAAAFTPKGVARSLTGLGDSVRKFVDDVQAGMAERELELEAALSQPDPDRVKDLLHDGNENEGRRR